MIQDFLNNHETLLLTASVGTILFLCAWFYITFIARETEPHTASSMWTEQAESDFIDLIAMIKEAKNQTACQYLENRIENFEQHYSNLIDLPTVQAMVVKLYNEIEHKEKAFA